jgi:glycyl-tRNA synthetase alpha chain
MEVTQFTYFQQVGGIDLKPISAELTYGIERLAMYLQGVNNVFDLVWTRDVKYGDVHHETEVQFSKYNFELSDREMLFRQFESYEKECEKLIKAGVVFPAYDYCLKCSHTFNLLDAAGAISVTERTGYIARVRKLARLCAHAYLADREAKGFPMLKK